MKQLRAAGIDKIYGTEEAETAMDAIRHVGGGRGGTIVVTSLARLGSSREAVRQAISEIHERGSAVLELCSGRRSDDASVAVQMAMDAADEIAADHRAFSPREARVAAAKRWREEERPPRTAISKAKAIWRDTANYPTIPRAMEHADCKGWTQAALYKQFGARWPKNSGRGGRPRKGGEE